MALRIKGSLLIVLTVCSGIALSMTVAQQDNSSREVVAAITKHPQAHAGDAEQGSGMPFDLKAVKRPVPKLEHAGGLFESRTWYVPPAPAVVIPSYVPPAQPTTPPLPFIFVGRMVDGKNTVIFLSHNDRQYVVKENDVLENTYRVDRISDTGMELTYLPTSTPQKLSFNNTSEANVLINASENKVSTTGIGQ